MIEVIIIIIIIIIIITIIIMVMMMVIIITQYMATLYLLSRGGNVGRLAFIGVVTRSVNFII